MHIWNVWMLIYKPTYNFFDQTIISCLKLIDIFYVMQYFFLKSYVGF